MSSATATNEATSAAKGKPTKVPRRDFLLSQTQVRCKVVEIGNGETLVFRNMTVLERDRNEMLGINPKTGEVDFSRLPERKLRMLCVQMVEDPGTKAPCFEESEWQLLRGLDAAVAAKCFAACLDLNGFDDREVNELLGN